MGIFVFLLLFWLGAYVTADGWRDVRARLARVRRLAVPAAVPTQVEPAADTDVVVPTGPQSAEGPSAEGRLVTALLAGSVSADHYHRAMHVLATRDEKAHPLPPVPH